jgi:tetratricopeptide (TPR) repeat protein
MDQMSAHLERGWDLAQRGDTQGAASSARRALELDPNSPEVHNLIGFVAALDGDCDEAIEAYQQAMCLDDSYVEAMLNAAELLVHPMGEYEEAIDICDQILELTDFPDEVVDALLLKFEALLALGKSDDAKGLLARLPEGPHENPTQNFLTGRAFYEIGEHVKAVELIDASLEAQPRNAEALYYRGLLHEVAGDARAAAVAFLQSRQLEIEMGMPPWAPNSETFMLFTEKAIKQLPFELQPYMATAELYVADMPGPEVVIDGVDPRSMVLVDAMLIGHEDERKPFAVEPAQVSLRIFVYALNILRAASGLAAVQQTILDALDAEINAALTDLQVELDEAQQLGELAMAEISFAAQKTRLERAK